MKYTASHIAYSTRKVKYERFFSVSAGAVSSIVDELRNDSGELRDSRNFTRGDDSTGSMGLYPRRFAFI